MPSISIIVPIYKVERWLSDCIESVLMQEGVDFELLLINDGSPDNSLKICETYAERDARIKVISKPNGGLSSARNCGIENAKGDWLIFLDSDDYWTDSTALKQLLDYAQNLDVDVVRFEYTAFNEDKSFKYEKDINSKEALINRVLKPSELIDKGIAGEWFAWLYLLKKDSVGSFRFDENIKFQEDIDFNVRYLNNTKLRCGYMQNRFYGYRQRAESIITSINPKRLNGSFTLCDVFAEQAEIAEDSDIKQIYLYYSVMMYYWTLGTLSEDPYFQNRIQIIQDIKLERLKERTCERLKKVDIPYKYLTFLKLSPQKALILYRLKNKLIIALKRFLS